MSRACIAAHCIWAITVSEELGPWPADTGWRHRCTLGRHPGDPCASPIPRRSYGGGAPRSYDRPRTAGQLPGKTMCPGRVEYPLATEHGPVRSRRRWPMGWQEQQAAARAAEQQRQAQQRQASAPQAESIRKENSARNAAAYQRQQADWAASNARADSQRQARDRADSDRAHAERMKQYRQTGQNTWGSSSPSGSFHSSSAGRSSSSDLGAGKQRAKAADSCSS